MSGDFAVTAEEAGLEFWSTPIGHTVTSMISQIDRGEMPLEAMTALQEVLSLHAGGKIANLEEFSASGMATRLANLLNTSINHYMPAGIIDDSKASASDIKNLLTTASNVLKLINGIQKDLYNSDRMAAMERAIHRTFSSAATDTGLSKDQLDQLKQSFRAKLEVEFTKL